MTLLPTPDSRLPAVLRRSLCTPLGRRKRRSLRKPIPSLPSSLFPLPFSSLLPTLYSLLLVLSCPAFAQRGSAGYLPQLYRGQECIRKRQWSAAASYFRFALQWDHNGVAAHNGLGQVYLHYGRNERAIEEFNAALRLSPHSAEAERGLHSAQSEGEAEAAFDDLQEQAQREPDNADALTAFAESLLDRDRVDEAEKQAHAALRLNPHEGHAYCALGRIAAKRGETAEARRDLELAVKLDSDDDDAYQTLGDLAMSARDYRQAVTYFRRVVGIVPEEIEGHKRLKSAFAALGDTRSAEAEDAAIARLGSPVHN